MAGSEVLSPTWLGGQACDSRGPAVVGEPPPLSLPIQLSCVGQKPELSGEQSLVCLVKMIPR